MNRLTRFLRDPAYHLATIPVRAFDGIAIDPDPDLDARNKARAQALIAKLGPRWCCFSQRDAQANEDSMRAAHSHTEE